MSRIFVHASSSVLHGALSEVLALWPDVSVTDDPARADALLWEGEDLPPAEDRSFWSPLLHLHKGAEDPALRPPVRWRDVAPRLVTLLNSRTQGDSRDTRPFPVGPFRCVPLERTLYDADKTDRFRLTEKELALLLRLDAAGEAGAGRATLLQDVWGYAEGVDTHTLETHIYRLRQKIETNPENPVYLVTREGGYALIRATSSSDHEHPDRENR